MESPWSTASKTGTGINDKSRKPHLRYGGANEGGNCKKQIVVSDNYAGAQKTSVEASQKPRPDRVPWRDVSGCC
jgi:hypothetical protein